MATFVEQDESIAAPRSSLTTRACRWAIEQIRREHASVNGIRRQLGTGWRTVWDSVKPLLQAADQDPSRFEGVSMLGVDEHVWHHVSTKLVEDAGRGPKELTGMVDLTRDQDGRVRARLLDLVPGRSGQAYMSWLTDRGEAFRAGVQIATLDPFHGYKNAIDDQIEDAQQVRSAYHQDAHAAGRQVAEKVLDSFTSCPIPEVARLGRTLKQWRCELLGYFDTGGPSNGGTEAINSLIELHRRVARGFRNRENYRLRMLLIGGGLDPSPHTNR